MSAYERVLYGLAAAAALLFTLAVYRVRETRVPGQLLLVVLRGSALALVLLLLWDPVVPLGGEGTSAGRRWILLDASLSMAARSEKTMPWARGVDAARAAAAGGAFVNLFGTRLEPVEPDSLLALQPYALESRVVPALQAAAEGGARSVVVISDMRFSDGGDLERALSELPIPVHFQPVGAPTRNAAITEIRAPRVVAAGQEIEIAVSVRAEGFAPDQVVAVELQAPGEPVSVRPLAPPPPGATARASFRIRAPRRGGILRYDAVARAPGDEFPPDNGRSTYVSVASPEGGITLVSFRPDWEPRFLLPVLETATGLAARGFLRVAGHYVTMGTGQVAGRPSSETEVRAALSAAGIVVLHALHAAAPAWAFQVARNAPRAIAFVADPAAARALGLEARPLAPGDWYVTTEIPPSPLAAALAGTPADPLPPLTDVLGTAPAPQLTTLLRAQRARRGTAETVLLLSHEGTRRRIVATARGFWRWGFRPGAPREAYRRLWSAAAGWLLEGGAATGALLRPEPRVVARGSAIRWAVAPSDLDSVRLRVFAGDTLVADTVLALTGADTVRTEALAPGHYRYVASPVRRGGPVLAEGPFTVQAFTDEMLWPPVEVPPERRGEAQGGDGREARARRLHTHPAPYLLAVVILCVEWVLRRRRGLR